MNLAQEVPKELKQFATVMDKLAYRNVSYSDVFSDMLDYMIACFLTTGDKERAEQLQKKYEQDYGLFDELLKEYLFCLNHVLSGNRNWYDGLGILYETISSRWKSSALGQFFTPTSLVDVMTLITLGEDEQGFGKRVLDNCCGSGRMLISAHAHAPGNYQFGCDIDPICTKMSAINMMLHGCVGEACCMDSLAYTWKFGYKINTHLNRVGVPTIERIENFEDSYFYVKDHECKVVEPPKPKEKGIFVPAKNEPKIVENGQMSLF